MNKFTRSRIEAAKSRLSEKIKRKEEKEQPLPSPASLMDMPPWVSSLGLTDLTAQYRIFGKESTVPIFESNVGPQTWSMICPYDEVVIGGRRGGGKSVCLKAWMSTGDMNLDEDDPARKSYLQDPAFRGLFLREEYQAMLEFIDDAVDFYRPLGGKATGGSSKPVVIEFPSGAKIFFNHLGDENAFEKYRGWNLTRIGIEELTQIPTLKRYLKLLGSLRSVERVRMGAKGMKKFPELRTQIMATTNPDGPGSPWIIDRFIDVPDREGHMIAWNSPMRDPLTGLVRIFIPFPREANPYLGENTSAGRKYTAMLMSQDEVTRKQWMEGDWHAGAGKYFDSYRPNGPVGQEEADKFPWANHIIKSTQLQPWWYRWGSGDWGYDHPASFHKGCRNDNDSRVHIYDEMQVRRVGSFEIGALLAKWWYPELVAMQKCGQDPNITIHMGADIFAKSDVTRTVAEQMAAGIREVLGPYGALLLKLDESEQEVAHRDPKRAQMLFERRKAEMQGNMYIAIRPVYVDRIKAWSHLREWLRFRPAVIPLQTEQERSDYLKAVLNEQGLLAYEMQAAELRQLKPEILPKVQIWDHCKELDRCLKVAERDTSTDGDPSRQSKREDVRKFNADDEGKNGDDALESARNLCLAYQDIKTTIPRSYWINEKVTEAQKQHVEEFGEEITDPTRLAMVSMRQNSLYSKENSPILKAFTPLRAGATSRLTH